jgi:heme a synthase
MTDASVRTTVNNRLNLQTNTPSADYVVLPGSPRHSPRYPTAQYQQRIAILCLSMATATVFLMALGSATRVMNAGLSCPDWPLCYGSLIPAAQMNLQVFLEWFHRLVATSIGCCTLLLTFLSWRWRQFLPTWQPRFALACVGLVLVQGGLGGLTVTQLLRFDIVSAHLATGLLFFSSLLTMGLLLLPYRGTGTTGSLPWIGLATTLAIYAQSLLGALVASRWAGHQCLAGTATQLCQVLHHHFWGVAPTSLGVLSLGLMVWRQAALHPLLRRFTHLALLLLGMQVVLGVSTVHVKLQIPAITVMHQLVGALLLGALLGFTVLALRDRSQTKALQANASS